MSQADPRPDSVAGAIRFPVRMLLTPLRAVSERCCWIQRCVNQRASLAVKTGESLFRGKLSVVLRGRLLQISVGVTGTLHSARFISLCFFFNFFPLRSAVREKRGEIKEKTTERITGRCCPRLRDVYAKRRGFFETGPARGNENARRSVFARFARRGNVSDAIPASCRSGRRRCREGTRPRLAGVEPEKETVGASARGSCRVWEVVSDVRVCLECCAD